MKTIDYNKENEHQGRKKKKEKEKKRKIIGKTRTQKEMMRY